MKGPAGGPSEAVGAGWTEALAPAKVNLWLRVSGRRADGYHEVDTALWALSWCDRVRVRRARQPGLSLSVSGPMASADVPSDRRNLAWRAAEGYLERIDGLRRGLGAEIELEKHVPSQAGLGAGSADAAAVLAACEATFAEPLGRARAEALLAAIGSDCVWSYAAAETGFARARGRGERVDVGAGPTGEWTVALLVPDVGAPTAAVYAAWDSPLSAPAAATTVRADLTGLDEGGLRGVLSNDLERAALRAVPELVDWRRLLDEHGASHFALSGSGSSFFGLFRDHQEASNCLDTLERSSRRQGFVPRALLLTRPAGHGVRVLA